MTMSAPKLPGGAAKGPAKNRIGLVQSAYKGGTSTLCAGCGHDAITSGLIRALWEEGQNPYKVAKMSGIGCSSKTTAYFLSQSWGFNSVHGRMPSVATGALLANCDLKTVGVSGDGDTASIGMGQFVHAIRRNVPLLYIVENNGVYGLTKGQFSATADRESKSKYGEDNPFEGIDLCGLALELGATFVARSFSADKKQLVPILKAALNHRGTAVIDVLSPCVTFNNHQKSTRSYDYGKEHEQPIHEVGYVSEWEQPELDYAPGEAIEVPMPEGGRIVLKKLGEEHDPRDIEAAKALIAKSENERLFLTGLFYVDPDEPNVIDTLDMVDTPLVQLGTEELRPSKAVLDEIMESYR